MKKKLALASIIGLIAMVGAVPGLILREVTRCQVISPHTVSHHSSIRCEGTIYSEEGYDLLSSGFYQIEERYISLGDWVEKGETLAVLAPVGESPVLYLQTQGSGLREAGEEAGLAALAQSYSLMEDEIQPQWKSLLLPSAQGQEELQQVVVTAPATGIVTKGIPLPGSVVKPGMTICSVEGREAYFALLTVGEKDARKISVGSPVNLTGEGVGDTVCSGILTKIYPGTRRELKGTTTQKVVDLEVAIQTEAVEIRPGYTVKAEVFTEDPGEMMILPYESIQQDPDNMEYVTVAGKYHLEKRPVTTGRETLEGVEIVSGLSLHDLVVIPEGKRENGDKKLGWYLLEWEGGTK